MLFLGIRSGGEGSEVELFLERFGIFLEIKLGRYKIISWW